MLSREDVKKYHLRSLKPVYSDECRRVNAWKIAKMAAHILHGKFSAQRVTVFGSLAEGHSFNSNSDIDIAAWGINASKYYKAVADVNELSCDFSIDLVDPVDCYESVRKSVEICGIDL
jgi:predicted nucleotidyltransferase